MIESAGYTQTGSIYPLHLLHLLITMSCLSCLNRICIIVWAQPEISLPHVCFWCVFSLAVLSVGSSYIALQCPQVQIYYHHAGLWTGHHLCPQLLAPSSSTQVSHCHRPPLALFIQSVMGDGLAIVLNHSEYSCFGPFQPKTLQATWLGL